MRFAIRSAWRGNIDGSTSNQCLQIGCTHNRIKSAPPPPRPRPPPPAASSATCKGRQWAARRSSDTCAAAAYLYTRGAARTASGVVQMPLTGQAVACTAAAGGATIASSVSADMAETTVMAARPCWK